MNSKKVFKKGGGNNDSNDEDVSSNQKHNPKSQVEVTDNEVIFKLDNKKKVTVRKFKGKTYVDIREFYDDNGTMKPGKKGISLNLENWEKFKTFIDQIDESVANFK